MLKYQIGDTVATRRAYGESLVDLGKQHSELVVADAGVSNSTYSELFRKQFPERYFPMFIAEQNMVGVAVGLALRGKIPFISTFSAFLSRSHDQLRMAGYSKVNIKVCGSHSGVSIGSDGVSQMGLEDMAMFRSVYGATVLYPSDAVSTAKLVELAYQTPGLVYIRTTRAPTLVIYDNQEVFEVGGVKTVRKSGQDKMAVISAGISLHEALKAYEELKRRGINIRVLDLYCLKPINKTKLNQTLAGIKQVITVEDHYAEGGLGEAVKSLLVNEPFQIHSLSVNKLPKSGQPDELLRYEEIDSQAIIAKVKKLL